MIKDIQILRGAAVLMTFMAHIPGVFHGVYSHHMIGWWAGVDVFLVVSGYVISRSFLPTLGQPRALGAFWIKRAFRILPVAVFWASVLLLCVWTLNDSGIFGPRRGATYEYLSVLLHVKNFAALYGINFGLGPYWSLSLEEQFYVVMPIVAVVIPWLLGVRGLVVLLLVTLIATSTWDAMQWFRVAPLLAGILIYRIEESSMHKRLMPRLPRTLAIPSTIVLLAALMLAANRVEGRWFIVTAIGALLVWLASYDRGFVSLPGRSIIEWIGNRSYSLYVIHMPALLFVSEIGWRVGFKNDYASAVIAIALALAAAHASYVLIEQPMRRLGRTKAADYMAGALQPSTATS